MCTFATSDVDAFRSIEKKNLKKKSQTFWNISAMSALQAGEESETDSEDGEVQVPQVNSDAIQAGEESETDSEEEDGKGAVVHLFFVVQLPK